MAHPRLVARVAASRARRGASGVQNARPARSGIGVGPGRPAGQRPPRNPQGPQTPSYTPPAPVGSPWDAQAEREAGESQTSYGDQLAMLQGNWQAREDWYGLGATNNPYSQASLLQRRHEVEQRGVLTGSGNQLYAGSTVNARAATDRRYSVDREALEAQFAAESSQHEREQEALQHARGAEGGRIKEGAIGREEEREPPPAPLGPGKPSGGGGKKGGKAGKKGPGVGGNKPARRRKR